MFLKATLTGSLDACAVSWQLQGLVSMSDRIRLLERVEGHARIRVTRKRALEESLDRLSCKVLSAPLVCLQGTRKALGS